MTDPSKQGRRNRRAGASAERELLAILSEALGVKIRRQLGQERDGGNDGSHAGWSISVKYRKQMAVPGWWREAVEKATAEGLRPILFYRRPGVTEWQAVVPLDELRAVAKADIVADDRVPGARCLLLSAVTVMAGRC